MENFIYFGNGKEKVNLKKKNEITKTYINNNKNNTIFKNFEGGIDTSLLNNTDIKFCNKVIDDFLDIINKRFLKGPNEYGKIQSVVYFFNSEIRGEISKYINAECKNRRTTESLYILLIITWQIMDILNNLEDEALYESILSDLFTLFSSLESKLKVKDREVLFNWCERILNNPLELPGVYKAVSDLYYNGFNKSKQMIEAKYNRLWKMVERYLPLNDEHNESMSIASACVTLYQYAIKLGHTEKEMEILYDNFKDIIMFDVYYLSYLNMKNNTDKLREVLFYISNKDIKIPYIYSLIEDYLNLLDDNKLKIKFNWMNFRNGVNGSFYQKYLNLKELYSTKQWKEEVKKILKTEYVNLDGFLNIALDENDSRYILEGLKSSLNKNKENHNEYMEEDLIDEAVSRIVNIYPTDVFNEFSGYLKFKIENSKNKKEYEKIVNRYKLLLSNPNLKSKTMSVLEEIKGENSKKKVLIKVIDDFINENIDI